MTTKVPGKPALSCMVAEQARQPRIQCFLGRSQSCGDHNGGAWQACFALHDVINDFKFPGWSKCLSTALVSGSCSWRIGEEFAAAVAETMTAQMGCRMLVPGMHTLPCIVALQTKFAMCSMLRPCGWYNGHKGARCACMIAALIGSTFSRLVTV